MQKITITLIIVSIFTSVSAQKKGADVKELYQVEEQFSKMSEEKGMVKAFEYYCDEEGVLLRADSYPVTGKTAVMAQYAEVVDSLFTLTWKVFDARIATSGDLGYTYGTYFLDIKDEELEDTKGSYVTIWRKNEAGDWKFVLDTGQDGLGE